MNKQFLRIAFGYKMGVGKDEAVSYLINRYWGTQVVFAQPIYDILHFAQQRCGFAFEKDRKFLQFVGTEWAREKDKNIWIKLALESTPEGGNAFISDLRFYNEMKILKENGWVCVKINRDCQESRKGTGNQEHSSETELDSVNDTEWDYIIENNGTLLEFYRNLDNLVIQIDQKYIR
jgi:hypothetical protein